MTLPRYEQVGLSRDRLNPEHSESRVAKWASGGDIIDNNTSMRKQSLVTTGAILILEYYLLDNLAATYRWMRTIADYAEDYFLGAWRDLVPSGNHRELPPDRGYQDKHGLWSFEFQTAMVWCACLGDWQLAKMLAAYVRSDVRLDPDQKPANRAWLLYLAGIVAGVPREKLREYSDCIENSSNTREKFLLTLLQAISSGDDTAAQAAAESYFKHYKKKEAASQRLTDKVAMDGTFLVHYAAACDRSLLIPENTRVHIIPRMPDKKGEK